MGKLMSGPDSHPGQAFCLRMLAANDGVTQRDLAEAIGRIDHFLAGYRRRHGT